MLTTVTATAVPAALAAHPYAAGGGPGWWIVFPILWFLLFATVVFLVARRRRRTGAPSRLRRRPQGRRSRWRW